MTPEIRFYRSCLMAASVASEAPDRALVDLCGAVDADVLYTVLPGPRGWIKSGYAPDRSLGEISLSHPTGIARQVLGKRTRFLENEITQRGGFQRHRDGWPGTEALAYLAVPIPFKGQVHGVLVLLRARREEGRSAAPFRLDDLARAELLAEAISVGLENREILGGWKSLSETDVATGMPNHRVLRDRLHREIRRSSVDGESVSLLLVDVRPSGRGREEVLARAGRCLQASVRGTDFVAHHRGGELAVLLPDTDMNGAMAASARLNRILREHLGDQLADLAWGSATAPVQGREAVGLIRAAGLALASITPGPLRGEALAA